MRSAGKPLVGALLNRAHPLSAGLVTAFLLNEGGGTKTRDSAGKRVATLTNIVQSATSGWTGGGIRFDNTDDFANIGLPAIVTSTPKFSLHFRVKPGVVNSQIHGIYSEEIAAGAATNLIINSSNKFFFDIWDGTLDNTVTSSTTPVVGTIYDVTVTVNTVAKVVKLYVNGKLEATNSSWTGTYSPSLTAVFLGKCIVASASKCFGGVIYHGYIYNKLLGVGDIAALRANPYGMWEQPVFRLKTASGTTGTSATTNANDTSAASGTSTVTGTLAKTNANDTSAAAGASTVTGTLAKTNANDTSAAAGAPTVTGTLAKTNANDTSAASGSPVVSGTVARTSADDTVVAAGTTVVTGSANVVNADDTCVASGDAGQGSELIGRRRRTRRIRPPQDQEPEVEQAKAEFWSLLKLLPSTEQVNHRALVRLQAHIEKQALRDVRALVDSSMQFQQELAARNKSAAQSIEVLLLRIEDELIFQEEEEFLMLM